MNIDNMISRTPSNSFTISLPRRGRFGIDTITLHTTGNTTQSGINTIQSPNNPVSYHYIIDGSGNITQHVKMEHIAHHAGTTAGTGASNDILTSLVPAFRERRVNHNDYSIGIGLGDTFGHMPNNRQFEAMANLIEHIRTIYTINHITTHADVVPRHRPSDPVPRSMMDEFWNRLNKHLKGANQMNKINFRINGREMQFEGTVINGRTFVMPNDLVPAMGGVLTWEPSTGTRVIDMPTGAEMAAEQADRIASRIALNIKDIVRAELTGGA